MTVELIPANIEVLAFAFQDDKDTPADAPTMAIAIEDESLDPGVQKKKELQSDQTAQQGNVAVMGALPGGSFKKYVRPSEEDFFLAAQLGKFVDSGTTPKIHTLTIDPTAPFVSPYLSVWQIWPGELCVFYRSFRLASTHVTGGPGDFIEVEYMGNALEATYIDPEDAPDLTGLFADELAMSWAELAVSLGGVHSGVVNKLDLMISRAGQPFPGDNGLKVLDNPNGLLAITGQLEVGFVDDTLTRAANTGTTGGTALTSTVFTEALAIALNRGANLQVALSMAAASIQNFKTAFKTDGSTAISSFDFDVLRQADVADALTAVVKNAIVHSDRS